MQAEQFKKFFTSAMAEGVVLYHSGHLDHEMITSIGGMLRRKLQEEGATGVQSRKVFTAFMEMAQNIVHYAESIGTEKGTFGALSVIRHSDGFAVMCGNYLASEEVSRVRSRIEAVQAMSTDEVRLAYRQQLASDKKDEHSKGAGLGLLTMAASAKDPIEFAFDPDPPVEGEKVFLFLKAVI